MTEGASFKDALSIGMLGSPDERSRIKMRAVSLVVWAILGIGQLAMASASTGNDPVALGTRRANCVSACVQPSANADVLQQTSPFPHVDLQTVDEGQQLVVARSGIRRQRRPARPK